MEPDSLQAWAVDLAPSVQCPGGSSKFSRVSIVHLAFTFKIKGLQDRTLEQEILLWKYSFLFSKLTFTKTPFLPRDLQQLI